MLFFSNQYGRITFGLILFPVLVSIVFVFYSQAVYVFEVTTAMQDF